jgi:DNA-binding beta-propeller fold protein YncE
LSGSHREAGTESSAATKLPFTGLTGPIGVAVDTTGNVYVTAGGKVLKLPAGSNAQFELPFTGLSDNPEGVVGGQRRQRHTSPTTATAGCSNYWRGKAPTSQVM